MKIRLNKNYHGTHPRQAVSRGRQAGFTLLIAALVASIVLVIASAIFSIAQKQITLASLSQQSQYAFYAADSAAECVLYWDNIDSYFAAPTPLSSPVATCDGQTLTFTLVPQQNGYSYTTKVNPFSINGDCAQVTIQKCQGTIDSGGTCTFVGGATSTQIRSDGFNVDCGVVNSSTNALERSVNLNY